MRLMQTAYRTFGLSEAPLRGYAMNELFTAPVRSDDAATHETIRSAMSALKRQHPAANWILPLGIGGHVDHRLARDATLAALTDEGHAGPVWFYEDLPYAALNNGVADRSTFLHGRTLKAQYLSTGHARDKKYVLAAYWSQLVQQQIKLVDDYPRRVGMLQDERLWVSSRV